VKLVLCLMIGFPLLAQQYFPDAVRDGTSDGHQSRVTWYSKHLVSLKEPSLWELSRQDPKVETYRFLWLRTFDRPISIRISVDSRGAVALTTKITNAQGGIEPGRLVQNRTKRLNKDLADWVLGMLEQYKFWDLPSYLEPKEGVINLDGARWIIEGVKNGRYHVVDRFSPIERDPIHILGIAFAINLAELKLLYQEVY